MWVIYALGGGWGHINRAASLACAALASGHRVRILSNSQHFAAVQSAMPELDIVGFAPDIPVSEARRAVPAAIERAAPDCLIVDTFPRGLGGELARPSGVKRVLVHRDINPAYASRMRAYTAANFDLIVIPGPGEGAAFSNLARIATTPPWLIREPGEVHAGTATHVLVCVSGRNEEAAWYGAVCSLLACAGVPFRCLASEPPPGCPAGLWVRHWPGMDEIARAAVVVGGGGYNTVHECSALGIPLIARAWPRKYDRQLRRLKRAARGGNVVIVNHPAEAAQEAVRTLNTQPCRGQRRFQNGAWEAVRLIEQSAAPR